MCTFCKKIFKQKVRNIIKNKLVELCATPIDFTDSDIMNEFIKGMDDKKVIITMNKIVDEAYNQIIYREPYGNYKIIKNDGSLTYTNKKKFKQAVENVYVRTDYINVNCQCKVNNAHKECKKCSCSKYTRIIDITTPLITISIK